MYETVLFDGTDIKSAGVREIKVWEGALLTTSLRGDDLIIEDADGMVAVQERPFDSIEMQLGLVLLGTTHADFNDATRALRRLVKADGTVTLTRRLAYGTGNEQHTALARYAGGLEPHLIDMAAGHVDLRMRLLDGLWFGPSTTITGTATVAGDVRTRRMTVTFTGGTNPTLTNSTTGDVLTWTGAVGGTPVVVDVEAMSATRGVSNVSGALSWTRTYPMTLAAGSNTLGITGGGTVSIAYRPAFL
jgi:hypothetical protein